MFLFPPLHVPTVGSPLIIHILPQKTFLGHDRHQAPSSCLRPRSPPPGDKPRLCGTGLPAEQENGLGISPPQPLRPTPSLQRQQRGWGQRPAPLTHTPPRTYTLKHSHAHPLTPPHTPSRSPAHAPSHTTGRDSLGSRTASWAEWTQEPRESQAGAARAASPPTWGLPGVSTMMSPEQRRHPAGPLRSRCGQAAAKPTAPRLQVVC